MRKQIITIALFCTLFPRAHAVDNDIGSFLQSHPSYKAIEEENFFGFDSGDPFQVDLYADAAYRSENGEVTKTVIVRKDRILAYYFTVTTKLIPSSFPSDELIKAVRMAFPDEKYSILCSQNQGSFHIIVRDKEEVEAAKNDQIEEFSALFRP